jgi:hemerythrin-like domain-containing protein
MRAMLECHFRQEEDALFAALKAEGSIDPGSLGVLHNEHVQIRAMLAVLADTLDRQDASLSIEQIDAVAHMLAQHGRQEESLLYLMSDQVLAGHMVDVLHAMEEIAVYTKG